MRIVRDKTDISFGKLSDAGAVKSSGLADPGTAIDDFTQESFAYIVRNIVEMYGLGGELVRVSVVDNDITPIWADINGNGRMDLGEIAFTFSMNANMNPYTRESAYGKHFMFAVAKAYGYPVIFAIAAHEVGHLINHYTLCRFEKRSVNGREAIVQTTAVSDRWDELCADYQSGIILAMASPRLDHDPVMNMLIGTQADKAHPDGFWRVMAVDMGYKWACAHSNMLNSRVITDENSRRALLSDFMTSFYEKVYKRVDFSTRMKHGTLDNVFLENVNYLIDYI